ncbi:MAG: NlpC/P60 family protein [Lentilactobacillus hilgardii]|uniref:NlpC/P60 family protein n=1 Tax=Lactobacillaceae TaxID=33958 RepID=UPI0039E83A24
MKKKTSVSIFCILLLLLLMFTQSATASDNRTGYVYSPEISTANGGWNWVENGHPYTGFRFYMGTYYWFVNGVRQNAGWREAWGYKYYTDTDGRAVQGNYTIDGIVYNFGNNGTYYLRGGATGYLYTPNISMVNGGWNWIENGHPYTGFRFYMGTYYWFVNGVRQNAGWREAWGYKYYTDNNGRAVQGYYVINGVQYYFGNDGTYYNRSFSRYSQSVPVNINTPGWAGLCLKYVDDVFNISYNTGQRSPMARTAAQKAIYAGTMHKDTNFPKGVMVPVYWDLINKADGINYGHIAIWDGNGGFYWESTNGSSIPNHLTWDEIQQIFSGHRMVNGSYLSGNWSHASYIGWSETLEGVRIIK